MPLPPNLWIWIILIAAAAVIGFFLGITYRKKVAEREIASAEEEAKRIINESIKSAESKKREALVEAKEEIHRNRAEFDREVKERRSELQKQERRLLQKEENLDKKTDAVEKKAEQLTKKHSTGQEGSARNAREDFGAVCRRGESLPYRYCS